MKTALVHATQATTFAADTAASKRDQWTALREEFEAAVDAVRGLADAGGEMNAFFSLHRRVRIDQTFSVLGNVFAGELEPARRPQPSRIISDARRRCTCAVAFAVEGGHAWATQCSCLRSCLCAWRTW